MTSFSDTQGSVLSQGVSRIMDVYGQAPPIFTIEGTTGWDQHSGDGYAHTGLESFQRLAEFLSIYADLNQGLRLAGIAQLFKLEFYDYFTSNFWQIEPIGPQIFQQDSTRPLLVYYRFRWAATKPAGLLNDLLDSVSNVLDVSQQFAGTALGQKIGTTLGNYTPAGVNFDSIRTVTSLGGLR